MQVTHQSSQLSKSHISQTWQSPLLMIPHNPPQYLSLFSIAFQSGHKLFITRLELSLVEGTNWHLVTGVAQVHKHHYPGLLLWSRQVLLVDTICQSHCNKQINEVSLSSPSQRDASSKICSSVQGWATCDLQNSNACKLMKWRPKCMKSIISIKIWISISACLLKAKVWFQLWK